MAELVTRILQVASFSVKSVEEVGADEAMMKPLRAVRAVSGYSEISGTEVLRDRKSRMSI